MQWNHGKLDQAVRQYLKTPEGDELIKRETLGLPLAVFMSLLLMAVGLFLMATILGLATGVRLWFRAMSFREYRNQAGARFRSRADEVRGLIGHVVIVGPERSQNRHYGLLLGSFEDVPVDTLAALARGLGEVYAATTDAPENRVLTRLLRDDTYRLNRQRRVPEPFNQGFELCLFDIELDVSEPVFACAAIPDPKGAVLQVPWKALRSTVGDDAVAAIETSVGVDTSDRTISLAMLAVRKGAVLSAPALQAVLARHWKDLPAVTDIEGDDDSLTFSIGEAGAVIARMPAPIPWSSLEVPCQSSWLWPDAETEMKAHEEHFIITLFGLESPLDEAKLLTQVVAALSESCEQSVGIYWGAASLVISPKVFCDFAIQILPEAPPIYAWVNCQVGPGPNGKMSGYTTGMHALGHMDFETETSSETVGDLRERLFGMVSYVLVNGPVIKDGDTIGEDANERIKVKYSESVFGNERRVMSLVYSR